MSGRGSPIGLGFLHPMLASFEPKNHLQDPVARQVPATESFATPTPQLMASVAPSPSTFLPESAQTISLRAVRIDSQSFTNKSPSLAPKSHAALVAGSVSILVGVGGLVGVVCYKKKWRRKIDSISQDKIRKKTQGKNINLEDVEASPAQLVRGSGTESYPVLSFKSMLDVDTAQLINPSKCPITSHSFDLSTPNMALWSVSPSTLIGEQTAYLPWNTYTPRFASHFSTISVKAFRDGLRASHAKSDASSELGLNVSDGVDISAVILSSLHLHEEYDYVESHPHNELLRFSDSVLIKPRESSAGIVPLSCSQSSPNEESSDENICLPPTVSSSASLPLEDQGRGNIEASSYSVLGRLNRPPLLSHPQANPEDIPFKTTDHPPRLLELMLLESEVDLRKCLGLDAEECHEGREFDAMAASILEAPTVPALVVAGSHETVIGEDGSLDHDEFIVERVLQSPGGKLISVGDGVSHNPAEFVKEYRRHRTSRIPLPLFKNIVTRAFVHSRSAPSETSLTLSPDVLGPLVPNQTLSRSGSSSSSASSTSVVTLKMPSFRSPGLTLLTEEVLPPPSIIVSVPTDGSIRPQGSLGSIYASSKDIGNDAWEMHPRWSSGMENTGDEVTSTTQVVFDPVDENDDEVWDEAYARTCLTEAISSEPGGRIGTGMKGFAASCIVSSQSSELDLEDAVAKFPLPPNLAHLPCWEHS